MSDGVFLSKLHPDFHLREDAIVGEGLDGESYVTRLKDCAVELRR
jgi:hypothetical protein